MSKKAVKPIKKSDMVSGYVLGAIAQFLTIVMWFFPTLKATYFSSATMFVEVPEFEISLFSYSDQLPTMTNIINLAILLMSVVSLIWIVLPLVKKNVMEPHSMVLPAVFNCVYLLLFFVRFFNAISSYPLYDISFTLVSIVYALSVLFAFSMTLSVVIYTPRLKKQLNQDVAANNE